MLTISIKRWAANPPARLSAHSLISKACRLKKQTTHRHIEKFRACSTYFEIDVAVGQAVGAALVEEVNVLDKQAEERDDDLRKKGNNGLS